MNDIVLKDKTVQEHKTGLFICSKLLQFKTVEIKQLIAAEEEEIVCMVTELSIHREL